MVLVVGFREQTKKKGTLGITYWGLTLSLFYSSDGFWVGKSSLRSWRQLALEQLDEQDGEAEQSNGKMNGSPFNKGDWLFLLPNLEPLQLWVCMRIHRVPPTPELLLCGCVSLAFS